MHWSTCGTDLCWRTMAAFGCMFMFGLLHSVLHLCEAKAIQNVLVPHDVPVGYQILQISRPIVIDPTSNEFRHLFQHLDDGSLVTRTQLSDLIGKTYSASIKHNGNVFQSLHIKIGSSHEIQFHQRKYIGTIKENEDIGTNVRVIGHLSVTNSVENVTYSLLNGNEEFQLKTVAYLPNVHDNQIIALKSFDREFQDVYTLSVRAQSNRGTAYTTVEIHVTDVNDNIPRFRQSNIKVRAKSQPSWEKLVHVSAFDADFNDRIAYSLENSADFVIDSVTGEIFAEGDYLRPGSYKLRVYATDAAGHRSEPLSVYVEVVDDALKFRPHSQVHHLSKRATTTIKKTFATVENRTRTSWLFSVASTQPRPSTSTEQYKLVSSSVDIFKQPDVNGNVYLKNGEQLDYENVNHRQIMLTFNRTSTAIPEDFTILEVTLQVQDRNDEKPVFKNQPVPFLAAVSTNPSLGENVYTLYAEDPDPQNDITYNLESGGEGKFQVITEQDQQTGDMVGKIVTTVSGPGQFLEGVEYTLVVSAQDMRAGTTPPQKSDFALVKVLVGLRPPQLFKNPFRAKIYENSGTGLRIMDEDNSILVVRAKCFADVLDNKVAFELMEASGRISSLFSITSRGFVETLQTLDYEEPPNQYVLNVTATEVDTGLSSSAELIIDVQDVNDNSPVFQLSTYTFMLPEDTPLGGPGQALQVTATDRDSGANGQLEYTVSNDNFTIRTRVIDNQYIGQITVAKRLDYDRITDHQYRFNVTARDKGEISRSGQATVIVYVTNVNDESPEFGAEVHEAISEEQSVGSVVTIVQASDLDGDNIEYYFSPKKEISYPFRIDPDSGLITLTATLPESVPYYTLNITAYDDGSCCGSTAIFSTETFFVVEIKDTNNNQPQFPSCNYNPRVRENENVGTFVVQVTAIDDDRGNNGNITYSIVSSPNQQKQFEVNPNNGRVVTAVVFDRENPKVSRGVSVTVKAADQGKPQSLDSHCTFWVTIEDANDNTPTFDSPSYATSISEASAVVGRRVFAVRATDLDQGQNAEIVYTLSENEGDFFRIEADTGNIYMNKALHSTEGIMLQVKAEDKGSPPRYSFIYVKIGITDRTNKPPTWDLPNYEREYIVDETEQSGYIITSMSATSNIDPPFDGLSFALIDSMEKTVQQLGPFRIAQTDNTVRLILRGTLDYNVKNRFELRLRVTNQGQTPLSSEIRPIIVVKDKNNESPQFEGLEPTLSNSYRGSVPENEPPGQTVLKVKAVDADHVPPFNVVTYSLFADRNEAYRHFEIDSQSGIIKTRSQFDREQQSVYYIKVIAVDGANSDAPGYDHNMPNSATAQVQVIIADKNDNAPYFTQTLWEISVPEQQPDITGRILTVTAKDKDEADLLAYTITDGNVGNVFGIKQKTGDLYVAKTLDYETPPTTYRLKLMVRDGRFQNFTEVIINVTDVNDNAPEFTQNVYEIINVVEEVPPPSGGQLLVQVTATDKDVSRQNRFRYTISGDGTKPEDLKFRIEPDTGKIFLLKKLDRDLPNGREVYQFNVIVEDEPDNQQEASLFGYAYIKVLPKDINDNVPVFDKNDLQGSVAEHSKAGQSVMTVVATDHDAGLNGTVFYEIDRFGNPPADPDGNPLFLIISETGLIKTSISDSIDREKTAQYFLTIVAKDRGVEQRSSSATVTISVSDINDQVPQFVKKIYQVRMSENQVSGPVGTVSATDNDIDENARLTYTLKESDRTFFSIEDMPPNAGVLTVRPGNPVDYEKIKFLNLTVYVQDSNPEHKDHAYIEVTVEDYNDNAPEFKVKVNSIYKKENIPAGTSLWNCSAEDQDNGKNAEFEYSIDRRTDPGRRFTVSDTCEVKVRRGLDGETLDRETMEKYEVKILAIDKGYPPQTGVAVLRIIVEDLNDNVPELVLPHPAMVMELKDPPQPVVVFSAMDRDTPKFGAPFRFALPPCEENPLCSDGDLKFTMEFDPNGDNGNGTGIVTAMEKFFRNDEKFYYLPIIVSDMRDKNSADSVTGTRTLTIEIGDENNHPQKPGHKDIFVYKYDFKGATQEIVIGSVYAEDPDDWDVKDKHYIYYQPEALRKYFSVDYDTGLISMNKKTPPGVYDFSAIVWDFRVFKLNVTSTVKVKVVEITDEAVYSSGSVRFTGMTAEEFMKRPSGVTKSAYDKFRDLLQDRLKVPADNVAIFSVMNGENNAYTDIRYSAHGSPWYSPSKLDGIVSLDKDAFETATGITVGMVNIDMCLRETCEAGGCANILVIGDEPNYVNTNGSSFIGVATSIVAECQCLAQNFSSPPDCTPAYCHNGGQCVKDAWGDVRCDCPKQFDGPRCQMTKHSFDEGFALFAPFEQCEDSTTSIEFVSKKSEGLIFYNGPVSELGQDDPTDFISLSLVDGYPLLQLDHGTGAVQLTVDGMDQAGERHLQKMDDGRWHHIDIMRKGKVVTMIVDRCDMLKVDESTSMASNDRTPCEVSAKTPGENFFLNVNALLQLGGRYIEPSVPAGITSQRFKGCMRNLVHNGELYDLYTGKHSKGENHLNGCPDEDRICGVNSVEGPKCGAYGVCEMTNLINSQYRCICNPGYRTAGKNSEECYIETTIRDLKDSSFMTWQLKPDFLNSQLHPHKTHVQLRFRTRDPEGILLHLPSNNEEFITLEIVDSRVRVTYNLGGASGESSMGLLQANASNGQWHTVQMTRIGRWFELRMDGGEGRYRNESWGSQDGDQLISIKMHQIVSGAHVVFSKNIIPKGQDLEETCINDIRLNSKWFPMEKSEDELSEAAVLEYEENVEYDCTRDDCKDAECPKGQPFSMECFPLWGMFECRCPAGTYSEGYNCQPIDYCQRDEPCFEGATCIRKKHPDNFTCVCPPGWTGRLCNILSATVPGQAGITTGFIIIIVVCIFAVLTISLVVFLIMRYKKTNDPEKYMLDNDDDDIRENVINYNEEGAGEEDQDGYDINRLRKPDDTDAFNKLNYTPLQSERPRKQRAPGDRPEVGDFIQDRLADADEDPNAPPHDSVREFVNEGGESDAGSLSSLQTSSSTEDQDYDYLNDWGPKFSKLANLYGGDEED